MANINNYESETIISGTKYADIINNKVIIDDDSEYNEENYEEAVLSSPDSVSINGGRGNDKIYNEGKNVTIAGGSGNDSIYNSKATLEYVRKWWSDSEDDPFYETVTVAVSSPDNVSINGGIGNDYISNEGNSVTIDGGDGNDKIHNNGDFVTLNGDTGNDSIENSGDNATIAGGDGDDLISIGSYSYNNLIQYNAGDGNDTIYGFDSNDTLSISGSSYSTATSGVDIIVTVGEGAITLKDILTSVSSFQINDEMITLESNIKLTDGDDEISISRDSITIDAGAGNDSISNSGSFVIIDGGAGNDYIDNGGLNVSINGGAGNDSIFNVGASVLVSGGTGNDSIFNGGASVSVSGGDGDDLISIRSYSYNNLIQYNAGDGNDTIYGFDSNDTLNIAGGSYSTATSGSDVIVTVGKETITLKDVRTNVKKIHIGDKVITLGKVIDLTNGDDESKITRDSLAVNALGGNDTITNSGASVSITGGAGKDYIENHGDSVSIAGGEGDDSILNTNNNKYEELNSGDSVTITGGKGNDYILNEGGSKLKIAGEDGNDTILNNSTTIEVFDGFHNSETERCLPDSVTISGGTGDDSIYNAGGYVTITGGKGNDSISNKGSNVLFKYASGDGNDVIEGFSDNSTLQITTGTVNKARLKKSDIILTVGKENITLKDAVSNDALNLIDRNKKKIAIKLTGTTGNNTMDNNLSNVKIDALAGNDIITNTGSNVSINGGLGDDSISNWWNNSVTINGGAGNDSIDNYASNVKIDAGAGDDFIDNGGSKVILAGANGNDSIHNNGGTNISISGGAGNDSISNEGYADSLTINGGDGNDYITNEGNSKVIIAGENGNDFIFNKTTTIFEEEGEIFLRSPDSVSISVGAGTDYIFNEGNAATLVGGEGNDVIENHGDRKTVHRLWGRDDWEGYYDIEEYGIKVSINGGNGNDSILNDGGEYATINGGDGNDTIYSKAANVSINGGAGNDRISLGGSLENITIAGGSGNDTVYTSSKRTEGLLLQYATGDGNDFIKNWKSNDTLSVTSGIYSTKKSGSNVIVTVGDGKITLGGAAGLSSLNIEGIKKSSTTFTVTDKTKSPVTVDSAIKAIDASTRTKIVKITGNKLANTIRGGSSDDTIYGGKGSDSILGNAGNDKLYGESGNDILFGGKGKDSLWGGAGNDSLWGGSGNDTFIYQAGEGTDKIFDYSSGDMIQILKSNGKSVSKFTKSKFSDGTLSLTISGGGQISFENVTTSTDFNINGTSYQISGSKLRKNS